jgi:hypothetical protein
MSDQIPATDLSQSRSSLVCPRCKTSDGLWALAMFPGWHAVDAKIDADGRRRLVACQKGSPAYEVDRHQGEVDPHECEMGCSCGWEGDPSQLIQLGIDGADLLSVIPGQGSLLEQSKEGY